MDGSVERDQVRVEDLQNIPKWTKIYAQTRTVPVMVAIVVFLGLYVAVGGSSYLAGNAYRSGSIVQFCVYMCLLVLAVGAVAFFSVPRWGGQLLERVAKRYYSKEGYVSLLGSAATKRKKVLMGTAAASFGLCITASVVLGNMGYIPIEYMQPVSALYCIPFMVVQFLVQRPGRSVLMLLWPFLYGLHAILVVAGVPIQFSDAWSILNMLIPTVGYGMLASLASHSYNRLALRKLKRLARIGIDGRVEGEGARV